jgi:hypothetical protein
MREYADDMVRKGRFRIGTMYDYRKSENKEIGDPEEGMKSFSFHGTPGELHKNIVRFHEDQPGASNPHGIENLQASMSEGVPIGITVDTPDVYLFCMTHTLNEEVMHEFGCNACVEIAAPERFLEALNKGMAKHAFASDLIVCKYVNRWALWDSHHPYRPQAVKPTSLKHQEEVRFLWGSYHELFNPRQPIPLQAVFIEERDAARYCRRII